MIRQFEMLDDDLDRHHAEFGRSVRDDQRGVAYPAVFLLDRRGMVVQTRVHRNYRIRDTGTGLLEAALGIAAPADGPAAVARRDAVQVRAYLDSPTYRPYQQLQLIVELTVREGWHVYTAPVPDGYLALGIEVAPIEGLEAGRPSWPPGRPFRVRGLDERFSVLDGTIRAHLPLTLAVGAGSGDLTITLTVRYQACSDTACLPPAAITMDLPVREGPFAE